MAVYRQMITLSNKIDLEKNALEAMSKSYSPYSNISVGAALLCSDGKIYTGTNVENASYSITLCAERVALFKAISEGHRDFKKIVIVSNRGALTPCGACRQALSEFSPDIQVVVSDSGKTQEWKLSELFPSGFQYPNKS